MKLDLLGIMISVIGLAWGMVETDWSNLSWENNWIRYIIMTICGMLFIIIVYLNNSHYKYNKGSKILRQLQDRALEVKNELPDQDFEYCKSKMTNLCSKVTKAFGAIKGNEIATSIKFILQPSYDAEIITLARDEDSIQRKYQGSSSKDLINENYDFKKILSEHSPERRWSELYFMANNLPHAYGYYNSHLVEEKMSNGITGFFMRHFQWELPYKSTLIVPISNKKDDSLIGFLCIDSRNSFEFKYRDIELLQNAALSIWEIVYISISKAEQIYGKTK